MNRKFTSIISVLIIVVFIAYIVFDTSRPEKTIEKKTDSPVSERLPEKWNVTGELSVREGSLKAVSVSNSGNIYAGGDSFVSCYSSELKLLWSLKTPYPVTALTNSGDTILPPLLK
jgi:outer membrane protein assembly factor BamB